MIVGLLGAHRTTAYVIPVWITDLDQRINFILKNSGVY